MWTVYASHKLEIKWTVDFGHHHSLYKCIEKGSPNGLYNKRKYYIFCIHILFGKLICFKNRLGKTATLSCNNSWKQVINDLSMMEYIF